MELTLLAPTALSAACSKALAFWAAAGPTAGPSMRADTTTNVTSTFLISLLPKFKTCPIRFAQKVPILGLFPSSRGGEYHNSPVCSGQSFSVQREQTAPCLLGL